VTIETTQYTCSRCGELNPPWRTFETGWPSRIRYWCLGEVDHRPWIYRVLPERPLWRFFGGWSVS
jgi:hypothetical protein